MSLVLLLVLSLGSLVKIELATNRSDHQQTKAENLAQLALMQAIGELQAATGPDQRITARAELLDANPVTENTDGMVNPYWTGVWDVSDDDVIDYANTNNSTRRSSDTGNIQRPPRWLVSQPNTAYAPDQSLESINHVGFLEDKDGVYQVSVPLEEVPGEGRFGWWVEDEGVKAKVDAGAEVDPFEASNMFRPFIADRLALHGMYQTRPSSIDGAEQFPESSAIKQRLFDTEHILLLQEPSLDEQWLSDHYLDITSKSYGILSDSQNGGLKVDLSRGLEEQWHELLPLIWERYGVNPGRITVNNTDTGLDFWGNSRPAVGSASGANTIRNANGDTIAWTPPPPLFRNPDGIADLHGPSWNILYDYYHLHKPWSPYVPLLNVAYKAKRSFDGFISGKPLEMNNPDDWVLAFGNYYRSYFDHGDGLGVGGVPGLSDLLDLNTHISLRPAGPTRRDGFYPQSVTISGNTFYETQNLSEHEQAYSSNASLAFDNDRREPVWNALTPVLVNMKLTLSLSAYLLPKTDPTDPDEYAFQLRMRPSFTVWNPYNVHMNVRNFFTRFHFKDFRLQIYTDDDLNGTFSPSEIYFDEPSSNKNPGYLHERWGSADTFDKGVFTHFIFNANDRVLPPATGFGFNSQSTVLAPGEVKVFGLPATEEYNPSNHTHGEGVVGTLDEAVWFLTDQYNSSYYTYLNMPLSPEYGDRPNPYEPDPNKDNIQPANYPRSTTAPVRVSFFPLDPDDDFAPTPDAHLEMGMMFRTYVNADQPGYLSAFPATLFDSRQDVETDMLQLINNEVVIATIWYEQDTTGTTSADDPIFLLGNPRYLSATEYGVANALSLHLNVGMELEPSASFYDVQIDTGKNRGYYGSSFNPSGETELVFYDVPRLPLQSVGGFMHANLSVFGDFPNYAIGGGRASPHVAQGSVANTMRGNMPDLSFLLNDALFDEFFFSSVPPDWNRLPNVYHAYSGQLDTLWPPFEPVDAAYVDAGKPLPNLRMHYYKQSGESTADYLARLRDLKAAGGALMVDGMFNINSTSVDAWKAVLAATGNGLTNNIEIRDAASGSSTRIDVDDLTASFPRLSEPTGRPGDAWRGYRQLDANELEDLAKAIVKQVKLRGPFSSLADFVNRRLVSGDLGEMSALEAAIDEAGINSEQDGGAEGIPGYLIQNDILRVLAPAISARSDTFTIHTYGEAVDPLTGEITATARLEAVVQRIPEYMDTLADNPEDIPEADSLNDLLGRRYVILSMSWIR